MNAYILLQLYEILDSNPEPSEEEIRSIFTLRNRINAFTEFYSKEDFDNYIDLKFNAFAQPPSVVYVTPYSDWCIAVDVITCDIPTDISRTIKTGSMSYYMDNMKGYINCHGETVAGFSTDYVLNGGAAQIVRNSLGNAWHVTAKKFVL